MRSKFYIFLVVVLALFVFVSAVEAGGTKLLRTANNTYQFKDFRGPGEQANSLKLDTLVTVWDTRLVLANGSDTSLVGIFFADTVGMTTSLVAPHINVDYRYVYNDMVLSGQGITQPMYEVDTGYSGEAGWIPLIDSIKVGNSVTHELNKVKIKLLPTRYIQVRIRSVIVTGETTGAISVYSSLQGLTND